MTLDSIWHAWTAADSTGDFTLKHIRTQILALGATCLAALPLASLAHHGWGGYDSSKTLKLTGTIEEATYGNPHGQVTLRTDEKTWRVVLAPPSRMENRGLAREMLKPGVSATVEGYPHREDANELRAERIVIDGKTIELR